MLRLSRGRSPTPPGGWAPAIGCGRCCAYLADDRPRPLAAGRLRSGVGDVAPISWTIAHVPGVTAAPGASGGVGSWSRGWAVVRLPRGRSPDVGLAAVAGDRVWATAMLRLSRGRSPTCPAAPGASGGVGSWSRGWAVVRLSRGRSPDVGLAAIAGDRVWAMLRLSRGRSPTSAWRLLLVIGCRRLCADLANDRPTGPVPSDRSPDRGR